MRDAEAPLGPKLLLLIGSLLTLVLLVYSAYRENLRPAWRTFQRSYKAMLAERATTPQLETTARNFVVEYKQSYLPDLKRVDRCQTCHAAIEDRAMLDAEQPLTAHPGEWLTLHSVEKFGCTICHDGQGRATVLPDAHGEMPHWEDPLLRGEDVYTSCGRCHYENDLYGAEQDLYGRVDPDRPIYRNEIEATLEGSDRTNRGKAMLIEAGCLGCHTYRGKGGLLGPDITYVGDKGKHGYSFVHVKGPQEPKQWLFEHFKVPQEISPGTLMPNLGLSDEEAWDLTAYMLTQHLKEQPARYTPLPTLAGGEPASGEQLYSMFCSSCHGSDGTGSEVKGIETPSLNNPDTLAVASDDYLRMIVTHGRPRTKMIPWADDGGGLTEREISSLVGHIRSWAPEPPSPAEVDPALGDAARGADVYHLACAGCHGRTGDGGIGTKLNAPEFLATASDQFLRDTLIVGRRNTAMLSWAQLSGQELSDVLAHVRSWSAPHATLSQVDRLTGRPDRGKALYRKGCASCHGPSGKGDIGPALNNQDLLALVDTRYLFDAIMHGRPGTAMPGWHQLSSQEVADLIAFIRGWQRVPSKPGMREPIRTGDWENGEVLYNQACVQCHGAEGEGFDGPQLNNPVLLRSMSDRMFYDLIASGRRDTLMPAFLRAEDGSGKFAQWQIEDIVAYIRRWERRPRTATARPGRGSAVDGGEVYRRVCAECHGHKGEGASGPALANVDFLRAASDGYLIATIMLGRSGTEMPAFGPYAEGEQHLGASEVSDVVAFIRQWEHHPPQGIPQRRVAGDVAQGQEAFGEYCIDCHGKGGRGGEAPELNNQGFLNAATDGFLQATIARGRQDTNMQPYGIGADGDVALPMQTINDLVAYIRSWDERVAPAQAELPDAPTIEDADVAAE